MFYRQLSTCVDYFCAVLRPVVVMALVCATTLSVSYASARHQSGDKPNIIFILSDDEDLAAHAYMPKTKTLLHDQGTTFTNFFVSYSLCCPSRASILTGQYSHNTHIEGNDPPAGGFIKAYQLAMEQQTLPVWLQQAGYHTMLVGKYLNGYGRAETADIVSPTYIPPGWDEWYGAMAAAPYRDYDYDLNEAGAVVHYGAAASDYLTDVIAQKAVDAIHRSADSSQPLFLYLAPFTPHFPAQYAPRHAQMFSDFKLPRTPSFNEADVTDKPYIIKISKLLTATQIRQLETLYVKRLRSLQAIDDLVEAVVNALAETNQLDNTYIVYMSDNGFHMGEHRQPRGKNLPYEEDIRVPFVIRGPNIAQGALESRFGVNIDISPTLLEMAGVELPPTIDGRSVLSLLMDSENSKLSHRNTNFAAMSSLPVMQMLALDRDVAALFQTDNKPAFKRALITPLQRMNSSAADPAWRNCFLVTRGTQVGALQEVGDAATGTVAFSGLRCTGFTYVEWKSGNREFYDLNSDPWQLQNISSSLTVDQLSALSVHLHELASCSGTRCQYIENLPVPIDPVSKK